MNVTAFPLTAIVVLSFVDRLETWWGIAIAAAMLPVALLASILRDDYAARGTYGDPQDDGNVLGFFCVTLPACAAAVGGHFVRHGWGALVAGVAVAALAAAALTYVASRRRALW